MKHSGAAPTSPLLNKLVPGLDLKLRKLGATPFCYCHGGRGIEEGCPASILRSLPWCRSWPLTSSGLGLSEISSVRAPWRRADQRCRSSGCIFNNMLVSCSSDGLGESLVAASGSRHGGEQEEDCSSQACWQSGRQQGSSEAAPRRTSMVDLVWLPSLKVEGRPLHPSSSGAVFPGRRLKVKINLRADVPTWRPTDSGVVGSQHLTPSGSIPGGDVLGCTGVSCRGGEGAGLDGVSPVCCRVTYAYCKGLCVIFSFFGPFVKCHRNE